ncbi:hypothetical protein BU24DRAFT_181845 [Aaosphaeria arxii CBS 175.79]|uniref:Secreted protein n=1 Tax=Aaosphaeria arxii CBS 175.79 TaxID=1450172 RepID=A0A6A5XR08_9PLEO|nr:uncharacterized protein BU24DRAFT_181845 [Aaosphaeria arxii CBS 175.79]KAF2015612.1 hypothetical protein BU24DRAFT_181845 [Aaosphaeria arxii CBS 175.79]
MFAFFSRSSMIIILLQIKLAYSMSACEIWTMAWSGSVVGGGTPVVRIRALSRPLSGRRPGNQSTPQDTASTVRAAPVREGGGVEEDGVGEEMTMCDHDIYAGSESRAIYSIVQQE